MDENNVNNNSEVDEKQAKKEHTTENAQKALQVGEKAAAAYFAGPAGTAAVNALHSAPVVGKKLDAAEKKLSERVNKNPVIAKAVNKAGDSGATDLANKGLDAFGMAGGGGAAGAAGGASKAASTAGEAGGASTSATNAANGINNTLGKIPGTGNTPNQTQKTESDGSDAKNSISTSISPSDIQKAAKIAKFVGPLIPYIAGLFLVIIIVIMIMAQIMVIRDKILGVINGAIKFEQRLGNFVTGQGWNTEDEAFFQRLKEEYIKFGDVSNQELDIPLIAATIHYSKITDINNWDGEKGEHDGDVGKNENNYSGSDDAGLGSAFVEAYQTWSFYQVANVKLGSISTLTPGQRGLLGHLVDTKIVWHSTCITNIFTVQDKWGDFFTQLFNLSTYENEKASHNGSQGAAVMDMISKFMGETPVGKIMGIADFIHNIEAFTVQDESALDWWSANVIYEVRELVELMKGQIDDSRLVAAPYAYYNYLDENGDNNKIEGSAQDIPNSTNIIDAANDYASKKDSVDNATSDGKCLINIVYPEIVRNLDYKAYYRYLVNVYIPLTYFRGQKVDKDYTFLEVVNIANDIFDQKYYYEYLVGKDKNPVSGCMNTFAESSSDTISFDKNMFDNLYVNVLSGDCKKASECSVIEETVPLKDYVMGVVYREIGASTSDNEEYLKANIVAAKSYTVGRRTPVQLDGKYYIDMLNSTNDQVYCSLTKGCMNDSSNRKPIPSAALVEYLSKLYDEVYTEFLYNSKDSIFTGSYRAKASQCLAADLVGRCLGQIDSHEMGDAGRDYLDILGNFYSQPIGLVDITTGKFSISVKQCMSSGLKLGTDGYYMRTTIPEENNIYFNAPYTLDSSRGQCVWYVKGRAQEIIANSIADADKKEKAKNAITPFMANGNGWYSPELTKVFGSSQDYKLPKAGAIAVYDWTDAECLSYWQSRGSNTCVQKYGHALIVESVDGDNVSISQGWTRCSTGSPAWSCVNFSYTTHPISYMKDLGGGYKFIGYIYLLN